MNIDMTRRGGAIGLSVAECIDKRMGTWRVRTDMQPDTDAETGEQLGVTFVETEYAYKPSMAEIMAYVTAVKNKQIDASIIGGYVWQGIPVWLSTENQFNYLMTLLLAKIYEGTGLVEFPIIFKLGTDEEPVMHPFQSLQELESFCFGAFGYIQGVLKQGWADKAAIEWSEYEQALNPESV